MSSSLFALTDLEASIPGLVPSSFVAKSGGGHSRRAGGVSFGGVSFLALTGCAGRPEASKELGTVKPNGTQDKTHPSRKGSAVFGGLVASELEVNVPALKPFLR